MAVKILHKRSAVQFKNATPAQLEDGELGINFHESGPYLQCRNTDGEIINLGGIYFTDATGSAPSNPLEGRIWCQGDTLKIYDGTRWITFGFGGGDTGGGNGQAALVIGGDGIIIDDEDDGIRQRVITVVADVDEQRGLAFEDEHTYIKLGNGVQFDDTGAIEAKVAGGIIIDGDGNIIIDPNLVPNDGKLTFADEEGDPLEGEFTANQADDTVIVLPGAHGFDWENCVPIDSVDRADYSFTVAANSKGNYDAEAEHGVPDEITHYSGGYRKDAFHNELLDLDKLEYIKERCVAQDGCHWSSTASSLTVDQVLVWNDKVNKNGESPLVLVWLYYRGPDESVGDVPITFWSLFDEDNEPSICPEGPCYDPCHHEHCEYDGDCAVELEFKADFNPCQEYGPPFKTEYNDVCRLAPEGDTEAESNEKDGIEPAANESCKEDWWFVVCEAKNDYIGIKYRDYGDGSNTGDRITWNPDKLHDPHSILSSLERPNGMFWKKFQWKLEGGRILVGFADGDNYYTDDPVPKEDLSVINIDKDPAASNYCATMRHLPEEERSGWRELILEERVADGTATDGSEYEVIWDQQNSTNASVKVIFHQNYWNQLKNLVYNDPIDLKFDKTGDYYKRFYVEKPAERTERQSFYVIQFYYTFNSGNPKEPPDIGTELRIKYQGIEEPDHNHFYSFPHNPIDGKIYAREADKWVPIDNHLESVIDVYAYRLDPNRHELIIEIVRKDSDKHHPLYTMHWRLNNIHLEGKNASGVEQSLPQWDQFIEPYESEGPYHWSDERILNFKVNLKRAADMPDGQKPPMFDEVYLDIEYESQAHRIIDMRAKGRYDSKLVSPVTVHSVVSESLGIQVTEFDPENPNYSEA